MRTAWMGILCVGAPARISIALVDYILLDPTRHTMCFLGLNMCRFTIVEIRYETAAVAAATAAKKRTQDTVVFSFTRFTFNSLNKNRQRCKCT